MATTDGASSTKKSVVQIAAIGHVYFGNVDTAAPSLSTYTFGNGSTLSGDGWTWLGDTSSENMIEFESDGGDTETKRTWDRTGVRATREDVTHSMTIHAVNLGDDVINLAFPGSTYDSTNKMWKLNLNGSSEKAILVVVEEGTLVSASWFPRVSLSGKLPTMSIDEFSEVEITGTLLSSLTDANVSAGLLDPVDRA